jgi:hypothetical protein
MVSGTTLSLTATVTNKRGIPLTNQPVTWSSSDETVASVSSAGVVTGIKVGSAIIRAAAGTITSSGTSLTVTPGAATALGLRTQPSDGQSGIVLRAQPVVEIRDAAGNVVGAATNQIVATIASGGGTLSGTATIAAVAGVASFTNLALTGTIGARTLTFASTGLTPVTSSSFALGAGAPAQLAIRTQPAGPTLGALGTQPQIEIRDAAGNLVTTATNNVTAAIASGGGTLAGSTTIAAVSGVASFTDLAITGNAGARTMTFSAGTLTAATSSTFSLVVPTGRDFAIDNAQFTQGIQTANGSLPMVLSSRAAVVNVLVRVASGTGVPMQIVLRLFNAAGALIRADTAVVTPIASPSFASPTAQFFVPAATLQPGLRWQVVRDPRGAVPDLQASNDVYPATGTQLLSTVSVPTLKVRFVPITLTSHNNATGNVTTGNIPEYLRTLRTIHPIGVIDARVRTAFSTAASFGTPPSGGEAAFWTRLISELDVARVADPVDADAVWYGVVLPPTGFNFTAYGGFSYIPASGTATGPNTRTSSGVQVNWFSRASQARELFAHELAHTFGRLHAPCGGAGAPLDPNYPVSGGTIDFVGHDVYSWENGLALSAAPIPTSYGDIMGYCNQVWTSAYTYQGILNFRGIGSVAMVQTASPPRTRVVLVRGSVENGTVQLEPAFTLTGRPTSDEGGPFRAIALASDGRVLFSQSFTPATIDHAANTQHFTLAIPATPDLENDLSEIRVVGPSGEARMTRSVTGLSPTSMRPRLMRRGAAVDAECMDSRARGIVVLDDAGAVLAVSAAPTAGVANTGSTVTVLCSDGVRTTTQRLGPP